MDLLNEDIFTLDLLEAGEDISQWMLDICPGILGLLNGREGTLICEKKCRDKIWEGFVAPIMLWNNFFQARFIIEIVINAPVWVWLLIDHPNFLIKPN